MTANVLSSELQLLISESKRRNTDIRNAAEKSLQDLKTLPNTSEAQIAADLSRRPYFISPFISAAKSKSAKLVLPGITCLQRLISARALPLERLKDVLEAFQDASSIGLDVQLKILQSLPPFLQFYNAWLHGDLPANVLQICSSLQQVRAAAISSTASATFQQTATFLFERLEPENNQVETDNSRYSISDGEKTLQVDSHSFDAYRVLEDICLLTEGQKPRYLQKAVIQQNFGLELIETLLTNHSEVFESHRELQLLLRQRVVPLVTQFLSERLNYALTVRVVRILCIIIREFFTILKDECEVPLSLLNHMLDADTSQPWRRALCMETFRVIYSSKDLILETYAAYDLQERKRNIIQENLASFVRMAAEKPALIGIGQQSTFPSMQAASKAIAQEHAVIEAADAAGIISGPDIGVAEVNVPGISTQWSTMRVPCLDVLDKSEAPAIPETYIYGLNLSCIGNLSDTLARVVLPASMQSQKERANAAATEGGRLSQDDEAPENRPDSSDVEPNQRQRAVSEPFDPQKLTNKALFARLEVISSLITSCWPAVLATSSTFLYAALDADFYRILIRSCQKFTQVAGLLRLGTPRDAFMTTLAKAAIPANLWKSELLSPSTPSGTLSPRKGSEMSVSLDGLFNQALESPNRSRRPSLDMSTPTLSQRNLMCLRALINLAIALGPILDEAWPIVLDSIQKANVILSVSGNLATAREYRMGSGSLDLKPEGGSAQTSLGSEIAAVEAATARMLQSTRDYSTAAFNKFLNELCHLLTNESHTASKPVPTELNPHPKPQRKASGLGGLSTKSVPTPQYVQAAISKVGEVARVNLYRLAHMEDHASWDLLIFTLLSISTSGEEDTTARFMAADVLGSIAVEAAIDARSDEDDSLRSDIHQRSLEILDRQIDMLLSRKGSEKEVFASTDIDVQRSSLEALRAILDRCGDSLTTGWSLIFKIIGSAFQDQLTESKKSDIINEQQPTAATDLYPITSPKLARSAFGSVQLICSDFLSAVPQDCMPSLIDLTSRFCSQRADLNISLTAIGLSWNISDHLRSQTERLTLPVGFALDRTQLDDELRSHAESGSMTAMWMTLQRRLVPVTVDPRSDIRNGAIRTLFRIIDASGEQMDATVWRLCLQSVALQIGELNLTSQTSARGDVGQQEPATLTGLDSTSKIVLEDTSQVFSAYIEQITGLEVFDQIWTQLITLHGNFIAQRSPFLTEAAYVMLIKILNAANEGPQLKQSLLASTFSDWAQQCANLEAKEGDDLNSVDKAYVAYLGVITPIVNMMKKSVTDDMVQTVAQCVTQCVEQAPLPPYVNDADVMTTLQSRSLQILEQMDGLSPKSAMTLITSLATIIVLPFSRNTPASSHRTLTCIALSKGAVALLEKLVTKHVNDPELYAHGQTALTKALDALANAMLKKYKWKKQGKAPSIWRTATSTSLNVMPLITNTLSLGHADPTIAESILSQLVRISNAIGDADLKQLPSNDEVLDDETFDLEALQTCHETLVPALSTPTATTQLKTAFVADIFRNSIIHVPTTDDIVSVHHPLTSLFKIRFGRTSNPPFTPRLEMAYYELDTLFKLVSSRSPETTSSLAAPAMPLVLLRCALPLKTYIADQPLRGRMPTPMSQRLELLYILDKLLDLESDEAVIPKQPADQNFVSVSDPKRRHLEWLAPLMHRALAYSARDEGLSAALRKVLGVVIGQM